MGTLRRALVVRGGWEGHSPVDATDRFVPFLRDRGFVVETSETLDSYLDADLLAATDLVVQCWTMGEISPEQRAGLCAAVQAGTGIAGWHGGIADAFRADLDYNFMIGGQFICHPGDPDDSQFTDYEVRVLPSRAEHPIVAGIERISLHTEQYYVHADPSVDVLATTTFEPHPEFPWIGGATMPVVWTKPWGVGRVFVCTVGHKLDDLDTPDIRTMIERGLLWAAR
jgi:type 1 glutamine amidotransferase